MLDLARQGRLCGPSAPVVLRGRGREVLAGSLREGLAVAFCFPARIPWKWGMLWTPCSHWL